MGKMYERFCSLLAEAGIDQTPEGLWLLALFARLCEPYTPPSCVGGHDMDSHVLFMLVMAFDMNNLLGNRLGCPLPSLLAAIILHNLDRIVALKTKKEDDPHSNIFRANVRRRFEEETRDSPFSQTELDEIYEAILHHGEMYDQAKGSQLQRRVQEADMMSRHISLNSAHGGAHQQMGASWSNGHIFDTNNPWFSDMPLETRGARTGHHHSLYTARLGLGFGWVKILPEEVLPLVEPFLGDFIELTRADARVIAYTVGGENRVEEDLFAALGRQLYKRYCLPSLFTEPR